MAEETPKEKYERLQHAIQSEILTAYPNPTRKDCPGDAVVKQVAERKELAADEAWEHITHCSPCYAKFLAYKEAFREHDRRRKKWFRYQMVAAACLVIAAGVTPFIWNRLDQGRVYNAEFDLRHRLSFRGGSDSDQQPTQLNPPLTLRRGHVHLKIDLPETWQPGQYDIAFLDQAGRRPVFTTTGVATMQSGSSVLNVDARLDVNSGDYTISLRRQGSGWRGYPVRVSGGQDSAP
jgi:hypothetical protein